MVISTVRDILERCRLESNGVKVSKRPGIRPSNGNSVT